MLDHIDQRHRQIARGMEHGEAQRGGEHHVTGGDLTPAPQFDRPDEHARP